MKTGRAAKTVMALMVFGAGSCQKTPQCSILSGPAKVISVQSPVHMSTGTDAVITLNIKVPDTACVQDAVARIVHVSRDTFRILTEVRYTDDKVAKDCDCNRATSLKSSVTFRTDLRGAFHFIYDREQDMSNHGGNGRFDITAD